MFGHGLGDLITVFPQELTGAILGNDANIPSGLARAYWSQHYRRFEPNDEPLWSQLRLNIGVFMHDLFHRGAFQGQSPSDAYFVRCDSTTTTQSDLERGIVNIIVGFAPLKPAEFIVLHVQQAAGRLAT